MANSFTLPVGDAGEIHITVHDSPAGYAHDELFLPALRHNNRRRSFLFVSRILGKHLPISPTTLRTTTAELAQLYATKRDWGPSPTDPRPQCERPTLVIGFAETATAMGHCVFDALGGNVSFMHSTREVWEHGGSLLFAEETHSHATEHYFYLHEPEILLDAEEVIIVDDELTTGNTAGNLIEAIEALSPGKRYGVLSFLDWSGRDGKTRLEELSRRGISIETAALLTGAFSMPEQLTSNGRATLYDGLVHDVDWQRIEGSFPAILPQCSFLAETGRFGLRGSARAVLEERLDDFGRELTRHRRGNKTLCLGTGEFMYLPLRLAEKMGANVFFQATTRSPATPRDLSDYGIRSGLSFAAPDDPSRTEFVYNIVGRNYDEVFLFVERPLPAHRLDPLLSSLATADFEHHHLVILGT